MTRKFLTGGAPPVQEMVVPVDPSYFPGGMPAPGTLRQPEELSPGYVAVPTQPCSPAAAPRGVFGMGAADADTETWARLGWGRIFGQVAVSITLTYLLFRYVPLPFSSRLSQEDALYGAVLLGSIDFARLWGQRDEHLRMPDGTA
jgi:hypothetical protein